MESAGTLAQLRWQDFRVILRVADDRACFRRSRPVCRRYECFRVVLIAGGNPRVVLAMTEGVPPVSRHRLHR